MDVTRSLWTQIGAVAFIFVCAACSNKSADSVFPDSNSALDSSACQGTALVNKYIVQWEDGKFSVESSDAGAKDFKQNFIEPQLEKIKYVEYDRQFQTNTAVQQSTSAVSSDASWGQEMVQAPAVWSQGIKGQGVLVAVVDAFVDVNNPQIKPRIAINTAEIPNNGIDDDQNGVIDDYYGASFAPAAAAGSTANPHGSHVSGIIAADPNFGSVKGMAPQAQIIPAQFISNDGSGTLGDAIKALTYAENRGAKIINASWGGAPCVGSLRDKFAQLSEKGILVMVAAGNGDNYGRGINIDLYPEFPASFSFPGQITVAASTQSDFMTEWSNNGFSLVSLAAPGANILSTITNNQTAYYDGTSMATPFVSGAAALLWSAKPTATAVQIKTALLQSVDVTPGHEFKVSSHGRLNVLKALQKLRAIIP